MKLQPAGAEMNMKLRMKYDFSAGADGDLQIPFNFVDKKTTANGNRFKQNGCCHIV
jgi:hypothetical protein